MLRLQPTSALMPPTVERPCMYFVTSVTEDNRISIGLRREAYGDVERALMAEVTPTEARAYASQLISRAELAERRARLAAAEVAK
jgi:hypothetical protein